MSEMASTRVSHHPDWMISGLLRLATFADEKPDQPMFSTGVSYAQLKQQVQAMLGRSGLDLTKKEVSAGTYWLSQRIAHDISDSDTKESLMQKLNDFVSQYIVDKSVQRETGVSERSPIRDRKWWDENFTPPTDREAAADEEKPKEEGDGPEPVEMVYVGLDGDDMGHLVEDSLLSDDPEIAAKISNSIHDAHKAIRRLVSGVGGRLIFDGGDNMLVYMPNDPDVFEAIAEVHERSTKHTVTIGVGRRPIEAHYALVVGKNTGKDKIVIYDESVGAQHATIHKEQEKLEGEQAKLKYRASAVDAIGQEINVAERLREALSASGVDASDKAVSDLFWRLVQQFDLNDMRAIRTFFAGADDSDLVSAVKQTYAKRMDWKLRCSEARELTKVEGQAICHDLIRAIEAGNSVAQKFADLLKAVDDQALRDLDEASDVVNKRFDKVTSEFAKMVSVDKTLRYSHYADEVRQITAEIASMAIPLDQELSTALKAVGNAEDAKNPSVDVTQVVRLVTKWVERVNAVAMALDMVCVVSGARPMELSASVPEHFPGQGNVPHGDGQKSPYARHDWLTIEDYNKDKVDWRKTDDQAGVTLPGEFAERSVGGDAGGSPIYVP